MLMSISINWTSLYIYSPNIKEKDKMIHHAQKRSASILIDYVITCDLAANYNISQL